MYLSHCPSLPLLETVTVTVRGERTESLCNDSLAPKTILVAGWASLVFGHDLVDV